LNICNTWTDIALATPDLWAAAHVIFPCARGFKESLTVWLERSYNRPLSILLEGKPDEDVLASIWGHGERLRHLGIREADDPDRPQAIQILGDSNPGTLPSLETLPIRGSVTEFSEFSLHRICEAPRLAPNLVEYPLCDTKISNDMNPSEYVVPRIPVD
jgi:hypothetical protein